MDILIVLLTTVVLIFAASFFSGIRIMESGNFIFYALVFLLVYFAYSLLFLGLSNQTIGMMMSDLQVVGPDEKRPQIGRVLARCFGFLLSVVCVGVGLIWALFDRDRQCLHDRLSKTRVVRTPSPAAGK
jgi:uncharacterized RDD family membrane protein YckC